MRKWFSVCFLSCGRGFVYILLLKIADLQKNQFVNFLDHDVRKHASILTCTKYTLVTNIRFLLPISLKPFSYKVLLLIAGPLRLNTPPPLELNGRWNVGTFEKKKVKKSYFFLNGRPFPPPPY